MAGGAEVARAYVTIIPKSDGTSNDVINSIVDPIGKGVGKAGDNAGKIFSSKLKGVIGKAIGFASVAKLAKDALTAGGDLQQSYIGGLETLYSDAADKVRNFAKEAAYAGISMNNYAEQAVSFGASLKQAYEGDVAKAADAANTAIIDMADNAAKMGTPLQSIQDAYQGFAKQNYTMLDNLKLGYGGTKTEMERLLADAQELTGVEYNIDNLGDVYSAIHAVQEELNITGTASKEAGDTLTGALAAVKANYQNFVGSMAIGESIQEPLNGLIQSVSNFAFNNLIPMLGTIISALPGAVVTFIRTGVPALLSGVGGVVSDIAASVGDLAGSVSSDQIASWAKSTLPKIIASAARLIAGFASGLLRNLGKIAAAIAKIGAAIIRGLGSAIWGKITAAANGIKERFLAPIEALKEKISAAIERIKSLFNFHITPPHIPLPHFSLSGKFSINPPSIPHVGVSWYEKAANTPYMFTKATLFGAGERSDEILYGKAALMKDIREASGDGAQITNNFYIYDADDSLETAHTVVHVLKEELRTA